MGAALAVAGFAVHGLASPTDASGQSNLASRSVLPPDPSHQSIDKALAKPEQILPSGMPTTPPAVLGKTLDPLSPAEVGYARYLAVKTQKHAGKRVDGTQGYQFVSVDLPPGVEYSAARKAMVYSYDYSTNSLITQIVDLREHTVVEASTVGFQPAPSLRESAYAMRLLVKSPAGAIIRTNYKKMTGTSLTSPDQLNFHTGTFVSDGSSGDANVCGVDRCVTFQGASDSGDWLYFGNIAVDLTDHTVRSIS